MLESGSAKTFAGHERMRLPPKSCPGPAFQSPDRATTNQSGTVKDEDKAPAFPCRNSVLLQYKGIIYKSNPEDQKSADYAARQSHDHNRTSGSWQTLVIGGPRLPAAGMGMVAAGCETLI
jgi:hypothetical protein